MGLVLEERGRSPRTLAVRGPGYMVVTAYIRYIDCDIAEGCGVRLRIHVQKRQFYNICAIFFFIVVILIGVSLIPFKFNYTSFITRYMRTDHQVFN